MNARSAIYRAAIFGLKQICVVLLLAIAPANATEPRVYDCKGEEVSVKYYDHHGGEVTVYHISMDIWNGRAARYVRNNWVVKPGPRRPLTIRFEPDPPQKKGVPDAR